MTGRHVSHDRCLEPLPYLARARPTSPARVCRVRVQASHKRGKGHLSLSNNKMYVKSISLLSLFPFGISTALSINHSSPPAPALHHHITHNLMHNCCLDATHSNRLCHDAVAFPASAIATASVMVSWSYDPILSHAARLAISHRRGTRATGRPTATHKRQ